MIFHLFQSHFKTAGGGKIYFIMHSVMPCFDNIYCTLRIFYAQQQRAASGGEQAVCISEAEIVSWTMKQLSFYDQETEMKRLMPVGSESARRAGVHVE